MKHTFFYDTWAFVALADLADPAHGVAVELDRILEKLGYAAVTSDYVVDECVTFLNAAAGAEVALAFVDGLLARVAAGDLQLVRVGPARFEQALAVFRKLAPGERRLSFTDATSFAVMRELSIRAAFTADSHFHRAGPGIHALVRRERGRFTAVRLR